MDLSAIRSKVQRVTGRYGITDSDLNDHINNAQKWLDSLFNSKQIISEQLVNTRKDTLYVEAIGLRSVHEVWWNQSDGRYKLELKTMEEMRGGLTKFDDVVDSDISNDQPKYYSLSYRKYTPKQNVYEGTPIGVSSLALTDNELSITLDAPVTHTPIEDLVGATLTIVSATNTAFNGDYIITRAIGDQTFRAFREVDDIPLEITSPASCTIGYTVLYDTTKLHYADDASPTDMNLKPSPFPTIVLGPRPDEDGMVSIVGRFSATVLSDDADESFWSVHHTNVLVWATAREMEIELRNTTGANDFESKVMKQLQLFEYDDIEEDIVDSGQMKG